MQSNLPSIPVLIIAGPTASGKSHLAMTKAKAMNGAIINGDSMQIYQGLPILTAQPTAAQQALIPHYLYGALEMSATCSVARWYKMALKTIEDAWTHGYHPIVVGGTGMYLETLLQGISTLPEVPLSYRQAAEQEWQELGPVAFHQQLVARDPAASQLKPYDRQRLVRAWSMLEATGYPLSYWQHKYPAQAPSYLKPTIIICDGPRDLLRQRADTRLLQMLEAGALEELSQALKHGLHTTMALWKAVGVREFAAYLTGESDLVTALQQAQIATHQYIKRQQIWFKRWDRKWPLKRIDVR